MCDFNMVSLDELRRRNIHRDFTIKSLNKFSWNDIIYFSMTVTFVHLLNLTTAFNRFEEVSMCMLDALMYDEI